jgi:catechol 2,3-dioxygenase-like lactoylglutathione lyase family enzyme
MKLRSLVPVLDVRDVDASIDFYCEVLGFELRDKAEWSGKTEWALLKSDQVQLMLCAAREAEIEEAEAPGEGVFFLHHENIESLLVGLGTRGYTTMEPLLPGSKSRRDFYLRDPDGYVLWFSTRPVGGEEHLEANSH